MKFTVVTILPELIEPALDRRRRRPRARGRLITVDDRQPARLHDATAIAPSTTRRTAAARAW